MTPDEVRLLSNDKALLFVRGERPVMDWKYDLLRHPNIRFTEDGGAPPYDYTAAPDAHEDLAGDAENYELLDMDDFLPAAEQPKPMFTYPRRDANASQYLAVRSSDARRHCGSKRLPGRVLAIHPPKGKNGSAGNGGKCTRSFSRILRWKQLPDGTLPTVRG